MKQNGHIYKELNTLEGILAGIEKPRNLPLPVLMYITDNFSHERKIGHGGCGEVYKGILGNKILAVKRLFNKHTLDDKQFNQEAQSMLKVGHQNIVQFFGYCSNTEQKAMEVDGKFVMAEIRERLLCFEYISNGSLDNHLTDELRGLEWHTRYRIIKGICEGLQHLHREKGIIHMDLKPANILLDDHMVPKIADFGLSRSDEISQTMSDNRLLSAGYCAPEYQYHGKMSLRSDIYSLGRIIIELVTGRKENPDATKVLRRWRHRWNRSSKHTLLEYHQVTKCIELALSCMDKDPEQRPFIWDIIGALNQIDDANSDEITVDKITSCLEDMLGIEPLELHFPFQPNKQISCSFQLTNDTDYYFAFEIHTTNPMQFSTRPVKGVVPPRSKNSVTAMMQAQEEAPKHKHCTEFSVHSTRVDESHLAMDKTKGLFRGKRDIDTDTVNLTAVFDMPSLPEEPQKYLSEVPGVPLDEESTKYQGPGEASDELQLSVTKVETSSKVVFPLTLWLGVRHFLQRRHSVKKVGAQTETELKEKKLRVEDALNATEVRTGEMLAAPKHKEEGSLAAQPRPPLTPMHKACSGMDLTVIHQILVNTHYKCDEGVKSELSFDEWTKEMKELHEVRKCGDLAFRDKDFEAATEYYTQFIDADMVSPTVYARQSLCHIMCDRPDAALRSAMQAQIVHPDWPTPFFMQAVALLKLNMSDDAIDMLNMASELEERQMNITKAPC